MAGIRFSRGNGAGQIAPPDVRDQFPHCGARTVFRTALMILLVIFFMSGDAHAQRNFRFQKLKEGIYAAIAESGSKAVSNCLIIVTRYQVIIAGSHFVPETTQELLDYIKTVTPLQVRYIILTHHHKGFNYIDFDLPSNADIIASAETWHALRSEFRQVKNDIIFFDRGLTLKKAAATVIVTNMELGHAEGDAVVYLPEEGVLFTSDLFFNDVTGYMGDGHFKSWLENLEMLEAMPAHIVVPGLGEVTTTDGLRRFIAFFKDFSTEVLRLIQKGLSLEDAKRQFSLPEYNTMPGFRAFFEGNFKRAYMELKELK